MPTSVEEKNDIYNRVQKIKLDDVSIPRSARAPGNSGSWFTWVLVMFLGISWTFIGVKFYKDKDKKLTGNDSALSAENGTNSNTNSLANSTGAKENSVANGTTSSNTNTNGAAKNTDPKAVVLAQKGVLIPNQQISVSPIDVGGKVIELYVVEGKSFKKGDVLAKLEDKNYQAQVAEAEASLAASERRLESTKQRLAEMDPKSVRKIEVDQAKAQLEESMAMQARAKNEFERLKSINRFGDALSIKEYQQAEADLRSADARIIQLQSALAILIEGPRKEKLLAAQADVMVSEAEVKGSQARLAQAQWRLDNCTIRSPIDGVCIRKIAELGNLVNPMAFASGGGGICDLANLADMEVDMDIPERDIEKVYAGQKAKVIPDAFKNREYEAIVDRIMPIADDSKSIIKIRVKVKLPENELPGLYLKPKMSVVCTLLNSK